MDATHLLAASLLLVLGASALAQEGLPANQLPMYGGAQKSEAQKKADDALAEGLKAQGVTREEGTRRAMRLGWEAFHGKERDLATAMQRFNQAWLLDPESPDPYHGFALVLFERKSPPEEVEKFFKVALVKPGVRTSTRVDYGRFLGITKRYPESLAVLLKAVELDSKAWQARSNISFVYYKTGDFAAACEWARKAMENKDPLEPGYLEDMCRRAGM